MAAALDSVKAAPPFQIFPASRFTIEQLTAAYNQTRVDYLVPMPMNAARLAEYIDVYDVDLERSVVAVMGDQIQGLGMLGVRSRRTWITRMGVLPVERRHGVGLGLAQALLAASAEVGATQTTLEVIQNNLPAYNLFMRLNFQPVRELVVLRRPPGQPALQPMGTVRPLTLAEILTRLEARPGPLSWIAETASLARAENLSGLALALPDGGQGWLVFQEQKRKHFALNLSRVYVHTEQGDPVRVARALLTHLYQVYPDLDTHTENVPADDPHLPAFFEMGYVESFRRIEMHRLHPALT